MNTLTDYIKEGILDLDDKSLDKKSSLLAAKEWVHNNIFDVDETRYKLSVKYGKPTLTFYNGYRIDLSRCVRLGEANIVLPDDINWLKLPWDSSTTPSWIEKTIKGKTIKTLYVNLEGTGEFNPKDFISKAKHITKMVVRNQYNGSVVIPGNLQVDDLYILRAKQVRFKEGICTCKGLTVSKTDILFDDE